MQLLLRYLLLLTERRFVPLLTTAVTNNQLLVRSREILEPVLLLIVVNFVFPLLGFRVVANHNQRHVLRYQRAPHMCVGTVRTLRAKPKHVVLTDF